jgi:asparagine synthase (glutamine-hydrolysing)
MCGISGIANFSGSGLPAGVLQRMTDAIRHRGPDDEGCFADARGLAALGHRRLSIIDLSTGHQPLFNEDGTVAVILNGEIYNYLELRRELEKRGHRFKTNSDTEAIAHSYEEYGHECVRHFRGMFAIAIWNTRKRELLLARDRVGKKPIYYTLLDGTLYFASEIQSLYAVPGISREIDYDALDLYLTYSYVPSPRSIYKAIRKLPPAHTLVFNEQGPTIARYWQPEYRTKTSLGYEEAKQELIRILTDSVRLRLISDVPLGAFLSGGVDSGTIVALMSRLSDRPVKTYSIGFPDKEYNELDYAREVARLYKTDHHEFMVEPNKLDVLSDIVRHYGEPYGDSSAVPTWHLSRLTREHVTVALNGDGGDELFGGYFWYRVIHQFNRFSNPMSRMGASALHALAGPLLPRSVRRGLELLAQPDPRRFQSLRSFLSERDRSALYHEEFEGQLVTSAEEYLTRLYDESLPDDHDRSFLADFVSYLPEDLLVKVDRASMAHGLECRSPFLDHELVEFSCSLPAEWKISDGRSKRILKDAVADWFPDGFVERRKMGFTVPVGKWFKGELNAYVRDALTSGPLRDIPLFKPGAIEALLEEHTRGARDHEQRIWNLLMLSLWFEEHRVAA